MRSLGVHYNRFSSDEKTDVVFVLQQAKMQGYDQLEIDAHFLESLSPLSRKRLSLEARNQQLDLSYSVIPSSALCSLDDDEHRASQAHMQTIIQIIGTMGGGFLNGPLYGAFPCSRGNKDQSKPCFERSVKSLRTLSLIGSEEDVMLNVLPVNRYEHFLIPTAEQARHLVQAVNHPNCGIDLDTFHMNIEETSLGQAIASAGIYLRCVHLRDNTGGPFGSGCFPWDVLKNALDDLSYEGALVHAPSFSLDQPSVGYEGKRIKTFFYRS